MNKTEMDKMLFLMLILILSVSMFVGVYVIKHIMDMSYDMGVMAEKIGTLEELNPLRGK